MPVRTLLLRTHPLVELLADVLFNRELDLHKVTIRQEKKEAKKRTPASGA